MPRATPSTALRVSVGAVAVVLFAGGCAVGPDFTPPAAPDADRYTHETLAAETIATPVRNGDAQHLDWGEDLGAQWWSLFGSPALSALIAAAIEHNPDLEAAEAALRQAQQQLRAEEGALLAPAVSGSAGPTRERLGGTAFGIPQASASTFNVFAASVNVSYALDVFGGERRTIEGLAAASENQEFERDASYVTLTADVVTTAVQAASARDQLAATDDIIASEEQQLKLVERRFALGSAAKADVLQAQAEVAATRATRPGIAQSEAQAQHALATLIGRYPHDVAPTELSLDDLTLPRDLPVSLPSTLVAQRPDIRAQAALLHQASADIGVATANMLPKVTLTASYGGDTTKLSDLFTGGANVWSLGAGIAQPLFEGGSLLARRRAAVAAYDEAAAHYRKTVLAAFQDVANTLTALANDAKAVNAQYSSVTAAKASLDLTQRQYSAGAVNYVTLLIAQKQYAQARIGYVQAIASRFADTAALFGALGGGWWNRQDATVQKTAAADPMP